MFPNKPAVSAQAAPMPAMPPLPKPPVKKVLKADEYLSHGAEVLRERGKSYDKSGNDEERSMAKIVQAFNTISGSNLSETDGWMFMVMLKMARIYQAGGKHEDSGVDMINYAALATECMMSPK